MKKLNHDHLDWRQCDVIMQLLYIYKEEGPNEHLKNSDETILRSE